MHLKDSSKDQKTDHLLMVFKLKSVKFLKRLSKRIRCVPRLLGRSKYLLPIIIDKLTPGSNFALSLPLASYLLLAYLESSTAVTLAFQN